MRILITGRDGQVGWECQRSLQALGTIVAVGRDDCDLARPASVQAAIAAADPDLIVNAAAYTAVDRAESESELAHAVNADAPALMAAEARRRGIALIHLSTDYVFDGTQSAPYAEDDTPNPMSVYGRTKLAGEQAVLARDGAVIVLRTSWVYSERGHNFVRKMLRLAREREELRVVNDQWGAPTWARSIAAGIAAIVARAGTDRNSVAASFARCGGLYHMTAAGRTNWHAFAEHILAQVPDAARKTRRIVPISTADYPTAARRPFNSALSCARLAREWNVALPAWNVAFGWAFAAECGDRRSGASCSKS